MKSEHILVQNEQLFKVLSDIDLKISIFYRKYNNCSNCGSKLHVANYARKPKGTFCEDANVTKKHSFCCSNKKNNCRKRRSSPSLRYFMQFHYYSLFFIVIWTLFQKSVVSKYLFSKNKTVPMWTLKRWIVYWIELFPLTKRFLFIKSMFPMSIIIPNYFFDTNMDYLLILNIFKSDDFVNLGPFILPHNLAPRNLIEMVV